jgi:hypothetical protein
MSSHNDSLAVASAMKRALSTCFEYVFSSAELLHLAQFATNPSGKHLPLSTICDIACSSNMTRSFPELLDHCAWNTRFPGRIYLWSTDLHAAPIACNMDLYFDIGVVTHAEIDGPHCEEFDVCRNRLKIPRDSNDWRRGYSLEPNAFDRIQQYASAYQLDPEMNRVDVVICSHPAANCERYAHLRKPMIIYATTRLEFGRLDRHVPWRKQFITDKSLKEWEAWVRMLKRLHSQPYNIILANNLYDALYIKYHTGIMPKVLPSWCGDHLHSSYNPIHDREILIVPYRENLDYPLFRKRETWSHPILTSLRRTLDMRTDKKLRFEIVRLRDKYPHYSFENIAEHPAVLFIPYQVSVMTFFELYRLGIPIFAPSLSLLCSWQANYAIMWERVYGDPPRQDHSWNVSHDPNSESPADACYWIQFSDLYHTPHIILFEDWDDFVEKINRTPLTAVSENMREYSRNLRQNLTSEWRHVFNKIITERDKVPTSKINIHIASLYIERSRTTTISFYGVILAICMKVLSSVFCMLRRAAWKTP